MNLSEFDYHLPQELIAQEPASPRDHSRLLVYNRQNKEIKHSSFYDIVDFLKKDDLLFVNNSKVFKARVLAKKESGGQIEIFLLKNINKEKNIWQCLIGGKVKPGFKLFFNNIFLAEVLEKEDNTFFVSFQENYLDFIKTLESIGQTPLPPYIKRDEKNKKDVLSYQTVYAKEDKIGSSAAPTAGLHFTDELLKKIEKKGIRIVEASLHVGLGTFLPIKTENVLEHKMHSEDVEISAEAINLIAKAKNEGQRVIAVGTTSCRILESLSSYLNFDESGKIEKYQGNDLRFSTDIFIYPGYNFKIVDCLLTNFHLPKSSLLLLVSAFAGREQMLNLYQEAVDLKYRFFSYGDAMLII
ncbi:MAG: tRNA preQ1(34) S-adenosylmethionine ribosyltransferase-isomerase QueA [Patescibacteria group bacterium]|nr:tRNA preQ1(34) S-adenosylmethionine ribosyltransferase-isomerase QueA [Patescibacteria group bacterium]